MALSAIVAVVAIGGMFLGSRILSSRRPNAPSCPPTNVALRGPLFLVQHHLRFYIFAILFLIFDVEAVFLFPWAVIFLEQRDLGNSIPFYAMLLFLGILFFAIIYGWKKGVLEWQEIILGPGNQPAPSLLNQATPAKFPA